VVDRLTNELFVADGYGNHRVISVSDCRDRGLQAALGRLRGNRRATEKDSLGISKGPAPQHSGQSGCASGHHITSTKRGGCGVRRSHNRMPDISQGRDLRGRKISVLKESGAGTIGSNCRVAGCAQTYLVVVDDPKPGNST